jgi:hypothetical protein
MDLSELQIKREFVNLLLESNITKETLFKLLNEQKSPKKGKLISNLPLQNKEKSLIYPHTDSYLQSPDNFFLKCKRENYKDLVLSKCFEKLKIDNSQLVIEDIQEDIQDTNESVETEETREHSDFGEFKKPILNNNEIIKLNYMSNPTDSIVDMIKGINFNDINEYVPKNFRFISK